MISKLPRLAWNYTFGRYSKNPSTAGFWYQKAPARVIDQASLKSYRQNSNLIPLYLFDHTSKLKYPSKNKQGLPILNYDPPIGGQLNPEATFQFLLGFADDLALKPTDKKKSEFLRLCDKMLDKQTEQGDFNYDFDWGKNKAPWTSALAQSRGVSVFIRAWMLSKEDKYLTAAKKCVSRFDEPTDSGGYYHLFTPENCFYFEEYPQDPSTVINGFMATLFGLYELATWANDANAQGLLEEGFESLKKMLPHFDTTWWCLYDLHGTKDLPNLQSVFYQDMVLQYMYVLKTIHPCPELEQITSRWQESFTLSNKLKATLGKLRFKLLVR